MKIPLVGRLVLAVIFAGALTVSGNAQTPVRIGLLKFGTVAWEMDALKRHGLDQAHGVDVSVVEFASNEAAKVALQAGAVEFIVSDWLWVARQRADGSDLTFVPYSAAVGALMVPGSSSIADVAGLAGKRIGVVGGPLDKSWLLLRALAEKKTGIDLADAAEPVFGAPPLLRQELDAGRIDAILTYWHDAARLEEAGFKPVITVGGMIRQLGIEGEIPMLGYVFSPGWASRNPDALNGFLAASRDAKKLLAGSDAEWPALAPLIGSGEPAVLAALHRGFAQGVPTHWGADDRAAAEKLYAILAAIGGEPLVGKAKVLDGGTFWAPVSF